MERGQRPALAVARRLGFRAQGFTAFFNLAEMQYLPVYVHVCLPVVCMSVSVSAKP
jgi:hypothetical protein